MSSKGPLCVRARTAEAGESFGRTSQSGSGSYSQNEVNHRAAGDVSDYVKTCSFNLPTCSESWKRLSWNFLLKKRRWTDKSWRSPTHRPRRDDYRPLDLSEIAGLNRSSSRSYISFIGIPTWCGIYAIQQTIVCWTCALCLHMYISEYLVSWCEIWYIFCFVVEK